MSYLTGTMLFENSAIFAVKVLTNVTQLQFLMS